MTPRAISCLMMMLRCKLTSNQTHNVCGSDLIMFVACLILLLVLLLCVHSKSRPPNFPPGPPRLPFWGSYWFLLYHNYKFPHLAIHNVLRHKYKSNVLGFYLGNMPTVVACDRESVDEALKKPEFQGRMDLLVPRLRGMGKLLGVFFTDGSYWIQQRRFTLRHLRDFGFGRRSPSLEAVVEEEVRYLVEILQGAKEVEGEEEVIRPGSICLLPDLFNAAWINIIWSVMTGNRFPKDRHNRLRQVAQAALLFQRTGDPTTGALNFTPWLRYVDKEFFGYNATVRSQQVMLDFVKEMIEEHIDSFKDDIDRDFIDVYLNELKKRKEQNDTASFSEEQLLLIGVDFLFPSATATTATLTFAIMLLLRHPEVMRRCQDEIDQVVGRGRFPTLDDRRSLPYTEATFRESMRRMTLTPLSIPHRCTEDTYFRGYFIPKNSMVFASLYGAHMDRDFWGDPENFRPERFLDEFGKLNRKDYTVPFGTGKRLCAGETFARQNMFLFFSGMIQNFTFAPVEGSAPPDLDNYNSGVNISPKEFFVHAVPRA